MTVNGKIIYFLLKKDKMDLGNCRMAILSRVFGKSMDNIHNKIYFQSHERQEHVQEQSAWIYSLANHACQSDRLL